MLACLYAGRKASVHNARDAYPATLSTPRLLPHRCHRAALAALHVTRRSHAPLTRPADLLRRRRQLSHARLQRLTLRHGLRQLLAQQRRLAVGSLRRAGLRRTGPTTVTGWAWHL
jgi:hypothetical protein